MRVEAEELKPTTLKLPVKLMRTARIYALEHGTTVQALVAEALAELLKARGVRK